MGKGRPNTKGYFVKERLTEAREARAVTQGDIGASLKRSGSAVSNWERGEQTPEPTTLEELARVLGVFSSYFGKEIPEYGNSAIFFRSMANATKRVRTREKARVRWLQHTSLVLQEILEFPPVDFPAFIGPGEYQKLQHADLEHIASSMRTHWKLGGGPLTNMVLVAENAGVVVGIDEVGSTRIDGQGAWCMADTRPYILLARDKYTAFRRQMDIAHEMAHLVLHYGIDESQLDKDFDLIEDQAKYLASAFLLPDKSFSAEIFSMSLDGFLALKPRWKVAIGAMIMRARQLHILSEHAAQALWKYRATRGWHRREPLDMPAETPVEEPRLLRRAIEMIVDAGVRSKRELLAADIGLGAADIEMMAVLAPSYFGGQAAIVPLEPKLKEIGSENRGGEVVPFPRNN
jgi:Zn-dependent peptidase ImmA (M78 family)/transcriptional regulator with XRE-family HTH domain